MYRQRCCSDATPLSKGYSNHEMPHRRPPNPPPLIGNSMEDLTATLFNSVKNLIFAQFQLLFLQEFNLRLACAKVINIKN